MNKNLLLSLSLVPLAPVMAQTQQKVPTGADAHKRPNIILFLVDDMGC